MKLKNKLLPLTGIAVATATITPFVASCNSNKSYKGAWEWDAKTGLTLSTTPRTADVIYVDDLEAIKDETYNEITDMWISDIQDNYNVYYDDFASIAVMPQQTRWPELTSFLPTHISLQMNEIKSYVYKFTDASSEAHKRDIALISLDASMEGFVEAYDQTGTPRYIYTNCDMHLINIPFSTVLHIVGMDEPYAQIGFNIVTGGEMQPVWGEIDWSARITVAQSGQSVETYLDMKSTEQDIKFIWAPIQYSNPTDYLMRVFGLTHSYHFSLIDVETKQE